MALFTNVQLEETIQILAKTTFNENWFKNTFKLNISEADVIELLRVATKGQLFQFDGDLYEQIDGVAMGSPLGPLMANTFLCSIEEKLEREDKLLPFYRKYVYVDHTFALARDSSAADSFLKLSMKFIRLSTLPWKQQQITDYPSLE